MATLSAVVEITDRSTEKFAKMSAAAELFETKLGGVDRAVDRLDTKLDRLGAKRVTPKVDLQTGHFDEQLLATEAKLAMLGDQTASPTLKARGSSVSSKTKSAAETAFKDAEGWFGKLKWLYKKFDNEAEQATIKLFNFLGDGFKNVFGGISPQFSQLGSSIQEIGPAAGGIVGPVGAGVAALILLGIVAGGASQAILVVVAALASLLVPLAAMLPMMASLLGLVGAVVIPMVLWMKSTQKLVAQKEKLKQQLAQLTPGTQAYINKLKELQRVQQKLDKSGGEGVFTRLQKAFDKLKATVMTPKNEKMFARIMDEAVRALSAFLPMIAKAVSAFSRVMLVLVHGFRMWAESKAGQKAVSDFMRGLPSLALNGGRALGQLLRILLAIGTAVGPAANKLLAGLAKWLGRIADEVSSPKGMKSLEQWFNRMLPVFVTMVVTLAKFTAGLIGMATLGAPLAIRFFEWLQRVGPKIVDFIETMAKQWGPIFDEVMNALLGLVGVIMTLVMVAWTALKPVADKLFGKGGTLSMAIGIIQDLIDIFLKLGGGEVLGFVGSALGFLLGSVNDVIKAIKWLVDLVDSAVNGFNKLVTGVSSLTDMLSNLGDLIPSLPSFGFDIPGLGHIGFGGSSGGNSTATGTGLTSLNATTPLFSTGTTSTKTPVGPVKTKTKSTHGFTFNGPVTVKANNLTEFAKEIRAAVANTPRTGG